MARNYWTSKKFALPGVLPGCESVSILEMRDLADTWRMGLGGLLLAVDFVLASVPASPLVPAVVESPYKLIIDWPVRGRFQGTSRLSAGLWVTACLLGTPSVVP